MATGTDDLDAASAVLAELDAFGGPRHESVTFVGSCAADACARTVYTFDPLEDGVTAFPISPAIPNSWDSDARAFLADQRQKQRLAEIAGSVMMLSMGECGTAFAIGTSKGLTARHVSLASHGVAYFLNRQSLTCSNPRLEELLSALAEERRQRAEAVRQRDEERRQRAEAVRQRDEERRLRAEERATAERDRRIHLCWELPAERDWPPIEQAPPVLANPIRRAYCLFSQSYGIIHHLVPTKLSTCQSKIDEYKELHERARKAGVGRGPLPDFFCTNGPTIALNAEYHSALHRVAPTAVGPSGRFLPGPGWEQGGNLRDVVFELTFADTQRQRCVIHGVPFPVADFMLLNLASEAGETTASAASSAPASESASSSTMEGSEPADDAGNAMDSEDDEAPAAAESSPSGDDRGSDMRMHGTPHSGDGRGGAGKKSEGGLTPGKLVMLEILSGGNNRGSASDAWCRSLDLRQQKGLVEEQEAAFWDASDQ
eukprot:m51a1_g2830 hypothetical protein (487) ;mRNA; f:219721-223696